MSGIETRRTGLGKDFDADNERGPSPDRSRVPLSEALANLKGGYSLEYNAERVERAITALEDYFNNDAEGWVRPYAAWRKEARVALGYEAEA